MKKILSICAIILALSTSQAAFAEQQCSYDNQVEYDKATWLLNQTRKVKVDFEFLKDGLSSPINSVYVSTKNGGKINNTKIKSSTLKKNITYKKSFIDVTLNVAAEKSLEALGIDAWSFHWKRPGKNYKSLSADFIVGAFSTVKVNPPDANGDVNYDITYDPAYELDNFGLSFGNLLSVTADPSVAMKEGEVAHAELIKPGYARAVIHWKDFFAKWNDSFSTPYKDGDTFPLTLVAKFNPPAGLLKEVKSTKKDKVYKAKKYTCEVDYTQGNPFLDIPNTKKETWATMSKVYEVPVNTKMLP